MRNYAKAFEKSILDKFTLELALEATEDLNKKPISGQIKSCNNENLILKITDGFERLSANKNFKLEFNMNRSTFQMQHATLEWIRDHKLFDRLINNTQYQNDPFHRGRTRYGFK